MPNKHFELVVIGGGPGGLEAALHAAQLGISTALVSNAKIGGRATWGSLLPSKIWLAAAEKADYLAKAKDFGFEGEPPVFNLQRLRESVKAMSRAASERYLAQLGKAGVQLYFGQGFLLPGKQVAVRVEGKETCGLSAGQAQGHAGSRHRLSADNILIATGSGPRFLPDLKPNKDHIIAPRLSPSLPKVPDSLLMAGGGVTGSEYAYAFAALGAKVTLLQNAGQLLPGVDEEISHAFEHHLKERYGMEIHKGDAVASMLQQGEKVVATTASGKRYESEYGFIAIGRKTDLGFAAELGDALATDESGAVVTDVYGRTNLEGVYAIGDVTGAPMMANRAMQQARIAVHHIKEGDESTVLPGHYIEAAYTHPPVGQIGDMTPSEEADFVTRSYNRLLKAHLHKETEGLVKLKIDKRRGLILGAAAFGAHAVDLLGILQLAMNQDVKYRDLHRMPLAHPSISEILTVL